MASCIAVLQGPWRVTPFPPHEVRRDVVACWAMGLVRFASCACDWGPVVGVPGPRLVLWGSFLRQWGPDTGSPEPRNPLPRVDQARGPLQIPGEEALWASLPDTPPLIRLQRPGPPQAPQDV